MFYAACTHTLFQRHWKIVNEKKPLFNIKNMRKNGVVYYLSLLRIYTKRSLFFCCDDILHMIDAKLNVFLLQFVAFFRGFFVSTEFGRFYPFFTWFCFFFRLFHFMCARCDFIFIWLIRNRQRGRRTEQKTKQESSIEFGNTMNRNVIIGLVFMMCCKTSAETINDELHIYYDVALFVDWKERTEWKLRHPFFNRKTVFGRK